MSDTIKRIYELQVKADQSLQQLQKLNDTASRADDRMQKLLDGAKKVGAALGAAFVANQVVSRIKATIDGFDELSKAAQKAGVTAEELQRLGYAADMSGVGMEALQTALGRLSVGMTEIGQKGSEVGAALEKLGVSGQGSATEALGKIADRFAKMPDGAQKTAEAIKLFGRAGADLIPLLNGGSESLRTMAAEADNLGIVISGNVLKQAEAFNDNLSRLQKATEAVGMQLAAGMLPALEAITSSFADTVKSGDGFKRFGEGVGEVLAFIYKVGVQVAAVVQAVGMAIGALGAAIANPTSTRTIFRAWVDDVNELDRATKQKLADFDKRFAEARTKANEPLPAPKAAQTAEPLFQKQTQAVKDYSREIAQLRVELDTLNRGPMTELQKLEQQVQLGLVKLTEPTYKWRVELAKARDASKALADAEDKRMRNARILIQLEEEQAAREAEAVNSRNARRESIEQQVQAIEEAADPLKKYNRELDELNRLIKAAAALGIEIDPAAVGAKLAVLRKGLGEVKPQVDQLQEAFKNLAVQGIGGLADAIVNAGANFKEFAANFLRQIAKMIAQQALFNALKNTTVGGWLGLAKGGAMGSQTGLPWGVYSQPTRFAMPDAGLLKAYASGGILGEAGPEAILPLRRTSDGRLGVESTNTAVNVKVINNAGAQVDVQQQGNEVQVLINRVKASIIGDMRRGGTALASTMENTYRLSRVGA